MNCVKVVQCLVLVSKPLRRLTIMWSLRNAPIFWYCYTWSPFFSFYFNFNIILTNEMLIECHSLYLSWSIAKARSAQGIYRCYRGPPPPNGGLDRNHACDIRFTSAIFVARYGKGKIKFYTRHFISFNLRRPFQWRMTLTSLLFVPHENISLFLYVPHFIYPFLGPTC